MDVMVGCPLLLWEGKSMFPWQSHRPEGAALLPLQDSSPTSTVAEQCQGTAPQSWGRPGRAGTTGRKEWGGLGRQEPENMNIVLSAVWLLLEPQDVRSWDN